MFPAWVFCLLGTTGQSVGVTKEADRETTPEVPDTEVTTGNSPGKTGTPWGTLARSNIGGAQRCVQ